MNAKESPQIQAIRSRYRASLNDKAQMISVHVKAISDIGVKTQSVEQEKLSLQSLRDDLHKLAGSSGMYGYDDVSVVCRDIMRAIDDADIKNAKQLLVELQQLLKHHA